MLEIRVSCEIDTYSISEKVDERVVSTESYFLHKDRVCLCIDNERVLVNGLALIAAIQKCLGD